MCGCHRQIELEGVAARHSSWSPMICCRNVFMLYSSWLRTVALLRCWLSLASIRWSTHLPHQFWVCQICYLTLRIQDWLTVSKWVWFVSRYTHSWIEALLPIETTVPYFSARRSQHLTTCICLSRCLQFCSFVHHSIHLMRQQYPSRPFQFFILIAATDFHPLGSIDHRSFGD